MTLPTPTPPIRQFDRTALRVDLQAAGLALGNATLVRIFKREQRLEVWMRGGDALFVRFRDYAICKYSGTLGPKLAEGDLQAPEGFYRVGLGQLNPRSRHHLAFNLGFPNAHDRALGRTGSALMVHGGCSSVGCYAMGDAQIDEIYAIVEAALRAGQTAVDVHAFPFVLGDDALAAMADHNWAGFWANLKQGYDLFEQSRVPPRLGTCNGDYRFGRDVDGEACVEIGAWRA
ncbi:hypothetical protein VW29_07000 [Devosia limi DSM 17137]|uniref:L,D-TPase catalytic domain-containing protein n=1 Tax=Devosia limi DSM 17137 TaxID=1121477 RepID=A0A0F5LT17_9HYPH|nr:murein L,D-transpeptidase family protein [Devosia limi]KKB85289.1 hypothetical protein VW29_07000 [Devosia limi DSM 17137]SHF88679.1 hypothetical protein SAMN02745223_03802 [Devosia limi DSM 17137]